MESAARPTLREIRRELVLLRTASRGVTQERIQKVAKTMQRLPVVDREMDRAGIADRSVATQSVLECAVRNIIRDEQFQIILEMTLNLYGSQPSLYQRRLAAQDRIDVWVPKTYSRIEESAYVELAAVLIRLDRSPCENLDGRDILRSIRDLIDRDTTVSVDVNIAPILALLLHQIVEDVGSVHNVPAIAKELPNLAKWRGLGAWSDRAAFIQLIQAVLDEAGARGRVTYVDELDRTSDDALVASLQFGRRRAPFRSELDDLDAAIERLAEIIAVTEREDSWQSIIDRL